MEEDAGGLSIFISNLFGGVLSERAYSVTEHF